MDDFSCVTIFMMIASAICASSLEFTITNGPQDTTVCMNDMGECTCGFYGANPALTIPDWIIVTRSSDSSDNNVTYDGEDIVDNKHDGLVWQVGQTNTTSAPNSKLVVGPVDKSHNQSSYQCVFKLNEIVNGSIQRSIVKSSVGTLTVAGPPSIGNIVADKTCATSLSISWDTHIHPVCVVMSQLVTISSPSSGARTFPANDKHFTFTNLNSNTSYDVTITLRYKRIQTRSTTFKTLPSHHPEIPTEPKLLLQNDSGILVMWKHQIDKCITIEVEYVVRITVNGSTSFQTVTKESPFNLTKSSLRSFTNYKIAVAAKNSAGSSNFSTPANVTTGVVAVDVEDDNNSSDDSNPLIVIIVVISIISILIVTVIVIIVILYWRCNMSVLSGLAMTNEVKKGESNSYTDVESKEELAYAVTGPSLLVLQPSHTTGTETENEPSVHSDDADQDNNTPPLPPKINYAQVQFPDQLPIAAHKDFHVAYAETKPA